MSIANALEQSMLDLINAERAAVGVAPLVFNDKLNDSSEDHSSWMLDADQFSHIGENGSSPHERIKDAGYKFEGNYRSGENIAFQSERGADGLEDDVTSLHEGLMDSPGHRANILNPDYKEIGIGIERGDFSDGGSEFDSVMATQNFAASDADNSSTDTEEPADTTADAGDTPAPDAPVPEEPVDVTFDDGSDDATDTPTADDTPETEEPTDVTADAGDDMPDTPVGDETPDEDVPADDITADAGDDTVEDAPTADDGETADDTVDDSADDGQTGTDNTDMPDDAFEYDGDLYFVNIGELNFDCDGEMETEVVAGTDAEADAGNAGDTADTAEDAETADDTAGDDSDMTTFVQQLTDLLDDFFGDVCSCTELA